VTGNTITDSNPAISPAAVGLETTLICWAFIVAVTMNGSDDQAVDGMGLCHDG
jgi:hypothetical protein